MSDEIQAPTISYDYKVLVGLALALVAISIAYYFVRRYVPSKDNVTTLRVADDATESEQGA